MKEGAAARGRRHLVGTALGAATGFMLALVVSAGILVQRLLGASATHALGANLVTTAMSVALVAASYRLLVAGRDEVMRTQALGAIAGVLAVHLVVARTVASSSWLPWIHEPPQQLVNDLVCVFGILAFVWGCTDRALRLPMMIAGLGLVLGYELTASLWHVDGPMPAALRRGVEQDGTLTLTVQRFVGSEVTASGLGVIVFRLLGASAAG